jgi:hypothetical protein
MACTVFNLPVEFLSILSGWWEVIGGGCACLAMGDFGVNLNPKEKPTEGVLAAARRWRGSIRDKLTNIGNLLRVLASHKDWAYPAMVVALLQTLYDRLVVLVDLCATNMGSGKDRDERNQLLKQAIEICRNLKIWALELYMTKVMTLDELHSLAYLLPGEHGGSRARSKESLAIGEPKPDVIDADHVRVTVDHSFGENAGQVASGWPGDAKYVLIVITAADGETEIYRAITTLLHNTIRMPEGSRGKLFIVKAAFLRHPDDDPHFGSEPTFSMPLTTEDMARGEAKE